MLSQKTFSKIKLKIKKTQTNKNKNSKYYFRFEGLVIPEEKTGLLFQPQTP